MSYSVYSFAALSRLREGAKQTEPGPPEKGAVDVTQLPSVQPDGQLKLKGSARISGLGQTAPLYVRLFRRLLGRPAAPTIKEPFAFELVFNVSPKDAPDSRGLFDLRTQLGLAPEVKSAVIEIFVLENPEHTSKVDHAGAPSANQ